MRDAMDIEGLGEKLADQLVASGIVRSVADIYGITKDDLLALDGFAEKKALKILAGIEAARHRPLARVLYGLGIRFVGSTVAEILTRSVDSLASLQALSLGDLMSIDGVGPEIATSVVSWFETPGNAALVEQMSARGINLSRLPDEVPLQEGGVLDGRTFVLTGTLPNLSRKEASDLIRRGGGKVTGSVTGSTSFVVAGTSPGTKAVRAEDLGVPLLTEEDLLAMLA
jgi:DNA ligase (NAD+)